MQILEFNRQFMHIEQRLGLFPDPQSPDPGWWDVVRHDVMKLVYDKLIGATAASQRPIGFFTRLRNYMYRQLLRTWLETRIRLLRYDVLVLRAPRLSRNGVRVDIALDQVLASCPGRKLVINTFPHRYDQGYARLAPLAARPTSLTALEVAVRDAFGIAIDLDYFVRERAKAFEIALHGYTKLLTRVRPTLVLVNQNGIEKALFRATRLARIPCVEVQHGLINSAHPAYAYPSGFSRGIAGMFPDVLFALSQFWIDSCHYPAGILIPIGNDEFHPSALAPPSDSGDVLVISAPKYHANLSHWLRQVAPRLPSRHFVYKLHPAQTASFEAISHEFAALPNVTIKNTDVSVQALLAQARDVILIQSTVAYEAVQAGRHLIILPEQDYDTHTDLFALDGVDLVADVDHLTEALNQLLRTRVGVVFFAPFDANRCSRVLNLLMRGGLLQAEDISMSHDRPREKTTS